MTTLPQIVCHIKVRAVEDREEEERRSEERREIRRKDKVVGKYIRRRTRR